ncbi:MAG: PD-(D/E)XK nuclease family protein, partial [Planctomycetes bacterium]|nr:PD-(D/E)XK nuclease family protein [Planctomycetota bacterium]
LSMAELYGGLSLALPTYLIAVRELGLGPWRARARPGGAFFQSLTRKIAGAKDSKELERIRERAMDEGDLREIRPRGVFDADGVGALDSGLQPGERSPVIAAARKKDGQLGYDDASDHVPAADLDRILAYARRKLGEFADAILDGEVRVRPYVIGGKTPCTTCDFGALCRFEKDRERWKYRRLESLRKTEALGRIAEALAAAGNAVTDPGDAREAEGPGRPGPGR